MQTRRTFLSNLGLATAGTYLISNRNAYAEDPEAPELKEKPAIIEIVPTSKYVTATNTGQKTVAPLKDIQYGKNLVPFTKGDLETLLAEDKIPKTDPSKETPATIEKKVNDIFKNYTSNVVSLLPVNKKTWQFTSPSEGIFLTPEFILTSYSNTQETVGGEIGSIVYLNLSEKEPQELGDLEVVANSGEFALLRTNKPKKEVKINKIATTNPYQGEMIFISERDFPAAKGMGLPDKGGKIKSTEGITGLSKEGLHLAQNGTFYLDSGFRNIMGIGYATLALQKDEKLQISPFVDPMVNEFRMPGPKGKIIRNVFPGLIRNAYVGSLVTDSKGQILGITTPASEKGGINYITSPLALRNFLKQYQAEATKAMQVKPAPIKK